MKIKMKEIEPNTYTVYDNNNNKRIGSVKLFVDDKYWLQDIVVQWQYLRKGYGTEIIKFLTENFKPFRISLSSKASHKKNALSKKIDDMRYLVPDGFSLMKNCFQQGILSKGNFERPFKNELIEYQLDPFLKDDLSKILNLLSKISAQIREPKVKTIFKKID